MTANVAPGAEGPIGPLAHNTFNGIEKPAVEAKKQAELIEVFGTDEAMQKYLTGG
jgi:hypothetical protein